MIELTDLAQSILASGNQIRYIRVESWLGGVLLHDDVPIASGNEEVDRTLDVPERITLSVPRVKDGYSWASVGDTHPLAANGQRLRVLLGVGLNSDRIEWIQRGWFIITESEVEGDTVSVTAAGLLTLVDEARLISPYQPAGTFVSTLRGLVEPALTLVIDSFLVDRSVPAGINYDDDRLGAFNEVLDAWPAKAHANPEGYLFVETTNITVPGPDLNLSNGTGGIVVEATGASSREGAFTVVVARGTATDGGQVQGVAFDTSTGAHREDGPFSPLPVPFFFPSPLLTTVAQCNAAAASVLQRIQQRTGREFEITMVPHIGLQAGDYVNITTDDVTDLPCTVEYLSLPYTPSGGSQTIRVRSLA